MYHLVHVSNPTNEKNILVSSLSGLGYNIVTEKIESSWTIMADKSGEIGVKLILVPLSSPMPFVDDTFTDSNKLLTDHIGELATWTRKNNFWGNLQIVNGRICGDFNEANARTNQVPPSAEYKAQCKIHIITEEPADFAGPCSRLHATDSIFYMASAEPAMNRWRLLRMQLGTFVTLGVWNTKPVTGDIVELETRNATKKVLVNGVERISSTDNVITDVGYVGAYCNFSTPTQGVHLDDLKAYAL